MVIESRTHTRRSRFLVAFAGFAVAAGVATAVLQAPEPDPIPRRWQLDAKVGPLRLTRVTQNDGTIRSYFYLTYHVTNKTGEDVLFAPTFELANGEGEVLRSGRTVPIDTSTKIQNDLENPFLEDQISILGMILQGDENAKDGVVIWPANDLNVSELTVYASGFSGEVALVEVKNPKSGEATKVPLYKTLMLRYKSEGDMTERDSVPFEAFENKWIMR